ncbi:MAG: CDP-diacylglycerol--serine O-phosphatidyltransferase [Polyangiaceae bacterium]|nr:CDP-diacylglycerol--serine O-phosphatidyltransferase [Polyangiaceae bacterium]
MNGGANGGVNAMQAQQGKRRSNRMAGLRRTLFVLPSIITLSSVYCGYESIRVASSATVPADLLRASILILFAMVFDGLDGRVARMTRTQSAIGVQLDSLADVVSFGVAPAVLMYHWSLKQLGTLGFVVSFLYLAAGGFRLARFNVLSMAGGGEQDKCGKYFLGLPIPAAAGGVVALVIASQSGRLDGESHAWAMVVVTLVLSVFMISGIRFRSFKRTKIGLPMVLWMAAIAGSTLVVGLQFGWSLVLIWLSIVYLTVGIVESVICWPGTATLKLKLMTWWGRRENRL